MARRHPPQTLSPNWASEIVPAIHDRDGGSENYLAGDHGPDTDAHTEATTSTTSATRATTDPRTSSSWHHDRCSSKQGYAVELLMWARGLDDWCLGKGACDALAGYLDQPWASPLTSFSASSSHVPYVSNKLFNLASAAEGIHERLYPGADKKTPEHRSRIKSVVDAAPVQHRDWLREATRFSYKMTFEQCLRQLLEHAGPAADPFIGDRDQWAVLVKQLRNQFAHGTPKRLAIEDDVRRLSRLSATIDALLRLVLLREMGFSDEQCMQMTNRAPWWRLLKQVLPSELPEIF